MGPARRWVKLVKERRDEQWSMQELVAALCNRRYSERTIVYVESHDQSIVGDQTLGARFPLRITRAAMGLRAWLREGRMVLAPEGV